MRIQIHLYLTIAGAFLSVSTVVAYLFLKLFGLLCFIVIIDLNLNISLLRINKLLLDGDIDSNPGPDFDKLVTGSFHQGDMKFEQTAGIKCACNYLSAMY